MDWSGHQYRSGDGVHQVVIDVALGGAVAREM